MGIFMKKHKNVLYLISAVFLLLSGYLGVKYYLDSRENKDVDSNETVDANSEQGDEQTVVEKSFKNDKGEFYLAIVTEGSDSAKLVVLDGNKNEVEKITDSEDWDDLASPGASIVVGEIFAYVTNDNVAEGIPPLLLVDLYSYRIFTPDMDEVFYEAFSKMESNGMYGSQIVGFVDDVSLKIKRTNDSSSYTSVVSLPDFKVGAMQLEK